MNTPRPRAPRMGVDIKALVEREPTTLDAFASRTVAVDAYNALYQFLSTIRGPDGSPLSDDQGRVTSHLSGLLHRNVNYLSLGIRPVYVFDGTPPSMKAAEIARRRAVKKDAAVKYERAVEAGDMEAAKKYAQQTTTMTDGMVDDAKRLLGLLGIPCVDAPSEGEAAAAHLTKTGEAYASASQDFDSVLFGAVRLVRNFATSGRRKLPNRNMYVDVEPEVIESARTLESLGLERGQLVDIAILIGTDFNPDGFSRIGPKTALKLVREHGRLEDIPRIREELGKVDYERIRKIFLEPDVPEDAGAPIEYGQADGEAVSSYLVGERGFSEARVASALDRLRRALERRSQNLDKWF